MREEVEQESTGPGASRRVSRGLMRALECRQLVPGQRLVESELALQYHVGRNAVRESIQWLAAHGMIDLSRHRSAVIRQLDQAETLEVLDVAASIIGLAARSAALRYQPEAHHAKLDDALAELRAALGEERPGAFDRARRHFYRTLIEIGGNRELSRLFPAVGLHVLYAQYPSSRLGRLRLDDFVAIMQAVASEDPERAEAVARTHVEHVRAAILSVGDGGWS